MNAQFFNLTPHPIRIADKDGNITHEFPSVGQFRVPVNKRLFTVLDGMRNGTETGNKRESEMEKNYTTLRDLIDRKESLTEGETEDFVAVFGARCSEKTKRRLKSIVRYSVSSLPGLGIFERVRIRPHIEYVAGQSYPDEIRTVREAIIKG